MVWIGESSLYGENKLADAFLTEWGAEQWFSTTGLILPCQIDQTEMKLTKVDASSEWFNVTPSHSFDNKK